MSALFGLVRLDEQPVDSSIVQKMGQPMSGRGPDAGGYWCKRHVGLGCNRLLITPEAMLDEQPVSVDSLVLIADARIDNRSELIDLLDLEGSPSAIADSTILLAAYRRWGRGCPAHLIGDFVFVIWDNKKKRLFGARDPMGVRSLYYYHSDRLLAFASEMKGLFVFEEIPRRINEFHLGRFLLRLVPDASSTFYQHILRLPPAHTLVVEEGKVILSRYWSLLACPDIRYQTDREYHEQFQEIFQEAVHCRLRSGFPVGSTLSGGMDSSSITCVADHLLTSSRKPLHTFSAIFPSLDGAALASIDEREFIEAVVAATDVKPHLIHADRLHPLAEWPQILKIMDAPVFSPNLYIHLAMYRKAQDCGVRVLLDGIDGDTVISYGFERLPHMLLTGRLLGFLSEIQALKNVHGSRKSVVGLALDYGLKPLLRPVRDRLATLANRTGGKPWQAIFPLQPDFARRIGAGDMLTEDSGWLPTINPSLEHRQGLNSSVFPDLLETTGKLACRCGIEDRYPFFDRRLMEFCIAIPPDQKLRNGWSRWILRQALSDRLPEKIKSRASKARLSPNFNHHLATSQEYFEQMFSNGRERLAPYVNLSIPYVQPSELTPLQLFSIASLYEWLGSGLTS